MKKLITAIFLCLQFAYGRGQDSELDSIKNLVETYQTRDSVRVHLLINLTKYYTSRDINESRLLIEEAMEISKEIGYVRGLGVSLSTLSTTYVLKGELDKGLKHALRSREILDSLGDQSNLILTNGILARIYSASGKNDKALEIHLNNVELLKNTEPSSYKAGFYFYVAKSYEGLGELSKAEDYYLQALDISKAANFQTGIALSKGALGYIYSSQGQYTRALEFLNETLEFSRKHQQYSNIAATSLSLALCYSGMGNYDSAIALNSEAIRIYEGQQNYQVLKEAYLNQSRFLEKMGNFREANTHLKLHYMVLDTIFSKEKVQLIEDLQTKYETEKKESEIASLSQQAAIQELKIAQRNQTIVIGLVGFVLILIVAYFIYRERSIKKDRIQTELEHRFLRSQLNPHFIFNALLAIQNFMLKNDGKAAALYLTKFSKLMRQILESSREEFIPVEEEIEMLKNYLDIHQLRLQNSFSYSIELTGNIDPETDTIPPMFVQPFVENAIEYGIVNAKEKGLIQLTLKKVGDYITIEIKDNGGGLNSGFANPKEHHSLATTIIKERMELFNKTLKDQIQLILGDIIGENGEVLGTRVELKVPFGYI